ncbi:MAG TPA: hypothetical protein VFC46_00285, partial [Humisphaera sp.]|nr:hypothetical protein [Humisphaera sp.]
MVSDPKARREVVSALSAFMRGEIDNFAFDDAIHKRRSEDEALEQARAALWFFYDDCKIHRISVTEMRWNFLCRLSAFLSSDLEQFQVQEIRPASANRAKVLLGVVSLLSVLGAA